METNNVEASTRVLDAATSAVGTHAAAGDAPAAWHPTYADCVHFKSLLEYFVAHLEWKVNHDRGQAGFSTYIEPNLNKEGELPVECSGSKGDDADSLQSYIERWSRYGSDKVIIKVLGLQTLKEEPKGWYLKWAHASGANIKTRWRQNHLERFYLNVCIITTDYPQDTEVAIDELGLFDGLGPNQAVKDFFEAFVQLKGKFYEMWEAEQGGKNNGANNGSELNEGNHLVDELHELITSNKNLILTGAPGTGKTYLAKQLACNLVGAQSAKDEQYQSHVKFLQFHPSYDYTDFVEGLRPVNKDGLLGFERKDGSFKTLCKAALAAPDEIFVMIIDEINRGQVSKIFGELFFALDPDYRGAEGLVETQYQNMVPDGDQFKKGFYVPENVYIIGTMNDIDHSLEPLDFAFRRRFAWREIAASERFDGMFSGAEPFAAAPDLVAQVKPYFTRLNDKIGADSGFGMAYQVGPAYFLKLKNFIKDISDLNAAKDEQVRACLEKLWAIHLKPLLQEYLKVNGDSSFTLDDLGNAYCGTNLEQEDHAAAQDANNVLLDDFSALAGAMDAPEESNAEHGTTAPELNRVAEPTQAAELSPEDILKLKQLLKSVGVR